MAEMNNRKEKKKDFDLNDLGQLVYIYFSR